MARLDPLDDPLAHAVVGVLGRAEHDAVAGGDDVALVGAEGLQQPPRGALVERAVVGLRRRWPARGRDSTRPRQADGLVHVEMDAQARLVAGVDLGAADGALAGEIALAADPLALRRGVFLEAVLVELLGPVGRPRARRRDSCASRSSDLLLLLFGHIATSGSIS